MCSAQSFTSSEGRGENLTNQRLRRGDSAFTAKLHFQKMKSTWSQLTGCIGEMPQLKLNSTYRDGQLCSLLFFFFPPRSVKVCQFFFNFIFFLQNWRTSGFLNSSAFQLKDMFHFNFHSEACDSFLQVLFQTRHVLHIVCNAVC